MPNGLHCPQISRRKPKSCALEQGHLAPARVLIDASADVNLEDANGKTARYYTSWNMTNAKLCGIRDLLKESAESRRDAGAIETPPAPLKGDPARPR